MKYSKTCNVSCSASRSDGTGSDSSSSEDNADIFLSKYSKYVELKKPSLSEPKPKKCHRKSVEEFEKALLLEDKIVEPRAPAVQAKPLYSDSDSSSPTDHATAFLCRYSLYNKYLKADQTSDSNWCKPSTSGETSSIRVPVSEHISRSRERKSKEKAECLTRRKRDKSSSSDAYDTDTLLKNSLSFERTVVETHSTFDSPEEIQLPPQADIASFKTEEVLSERSKILSNDKGVEKPALIPELTMKEIDSSKPVTEVVEQMVKNEQPPELSGDEDSESSDECYERLYLSKYGKYAEFRKAVQKKEIAAAAEAEEERHKKFIRYVELTM